MGKATRKEYRVLGDSHFGQYRKVNKKGKDARHKVTEDDCMEYMQGISGFFTPRDINVYGVINIAIEEYFNGKNKS